MMVMDVKCSGVKHFSVLFLISASLAELAQKVSDFNFDLMILYLIEGQMSNFLEAAR